MPLTPFLSGLVEPCVLQLMSCKDYLLPLAPECLLKCLSVLTSMCLCKHSLSATSAFGCPEQRTNPDCLAVCTGRLAHREDERSQLHSFIHAWGHAAKGERVHHERVQIWRKVSALNGVAYSIATSGQDFF